MTVELRHLKSFLAVADAGGISLGAQHLGQAQSAVSQRLQQLERTLGVALVVRGRTGIELTHAGRALAAGARPAIAAVDEAIERACRQAGHAPGTVTLSAFSYMLEPVGILLAELRGRHPETVVKVREVDFTTQLRDLRHGLADGALLTFAPREPGLVLQRLSSHPVQVVLSERHRLAAESSVRFADIADERWPSPHPDAPAAWADELLMTARRGSRPPLLAEAPRNPDELWPLVAAGRAICTVPDYLASHVRAIEGLTAVPIEDADPLVLTLARRSEMPSPALAALFAAAERIAAGSAIA